MANKILTNPGTTIEWRDSGGDELITLASLATNAGRNGAIRDWGAAPRALRYHIKFFCQFNTAPIVWENVMVYIREGGVAASIERPTNDDGTGDVAVGVDASVPHKVRNLILAAQLTVDEASTSGIMSVEGIFETAARHFGPVVFNETADSLHSTAANNGVDITPIPNEIQ